MNRHPDNGMDVIDSRDVIKAIEDLEMELEEDPDDEDVKQELDALRKLADEGEGCSDWNYGETLIRNTYFKDYAMELAEDIGAIGSDNQWPLTCIDWERAARELRMDYTSVDFDGVTYWIRS